MHILLSNDDGILAPGLAAMYRELTGIGQVTVAAPASVQSAMGHAITVGQAIEVRRIHAHNEFFGWSVDGRPADCVKVAVRELVETKPDLVVAGINDGANVSINVLYSGTVAAAAEGALLGHPAVAVSLQRGQKPDFARAAGIARSLIETLLAHDLGPGKLVNINIPDLKPGLPNGVRVAAQALQMINDQYTRSDLPNGVRQYGLYGDYTEPEGIYDTDLHALQEGYVVVTPLHVDRTDRDRMSALDAVQWPDLA
ncbi:MAG: 5'/3'-nucleotidase SurE [Phycisphaerae bacterium]